MNELYDREKYVKKNTANQTQFKDTTNQKNGNTV